MARLWQLIKVARLCGSPLLEHCHAGRRSQSSAGAAFERNTFFVECCLDAADGIPQRNDVLKGGDGDWQGRPKFTCGLMPPSQQRFNLG
jgi:hypothetical protein